MPSVDITTSTAACGGDCKAAFAATTEPAVRAASMQRLGDAWAKHLVDLSVDGGGQRQGADADANEPPVNTLPLELLQLVFAFLDPMTLLSVVPAVCSQWRFAAHGVPGVQIDLRVVKRVGKYYGISKIWKHAGDAVGREMLLGLAERFRDVRSVYLVQSALIGGKLEFREEDITAFVARCQHLTDFTLCGKNALQMRSFMISEPSMLPASDLGDGCVRALADNCPRLRSVSLKNLARLTDEGVAYLAERCGEHLQSVSFDMCTGLSDLSVIAVAKHCPLLKHVAFCGSNTLTDAALMSIADNCPHLLSANFDNCRRITAEGWGVFAAQYPHLLSFVQGDRLCCWNEHRRRVHSRAIVHTGWLSYTD